jgi:hypothetical protein
VTAAATAQLDLGWLCRISAVNTGFSLRCGVPALTSFRMAEVKTFILGLSYA